MKTIFIVQEVAFVDGYYGHAMQVIAVFSTREKAQQYIDSNKLSQPEIVEMTVDPS